MSLAENVLEMKPSPSVPYWNVLVPEFIVTDIEASLQFYALLGFKPRFRRTNPDFAYVECGAAQLMLEQYHETSWLTAELEHPFGRGVNIQIEIDSLQALASRLDSAAIPLFRPITESWYAVSETIEEGQIELLVRDPDGYLLRFIQVLGGRRIFA